MTNKQTNLLMSKDGRTIYDHLNRKLLSVNKKGKVIIYRYTDTTKEIKEIVSIIYSDLTGNDKESALKFLDFEKEIFCS